MMVVERAPEGKIGAPAASCGKVSCPPLRSDAVRDAPSVPSAWLKAGSFSNSSKFVMARRKCASPLGGSSANAEEKSAAAWLGCTRQHAHLPAPQSKCLRPENLGMWQPSPSLEARASYVSEWRIEWYLLKAALDHGIYPAGKEITES